MQAVLSKVGHAYPRMIPCASAVETPTANLSHTEVYSGIYLFDVSK